jgi:hypothetical protein
MYRICRGTELWLGSKVEWLRIVCGDALLVVVVVVVMMTCWKLFQNCKVSM